MIRSRCWPENKQNRTEPSSHPPLLFLLTPLLCSRRRCIFCTIWMRVLLYSRGLFFTSSFDKGLLYYHSAASCVHNLMDFARPTSSRWRIELRLDLHMCWDGMRWDGWKAMLVSNVQRNQHYGNGIHNSFLCCPLFVFHAAHYIISSATACIVRSFVALLLLLASSRIFPPPSLPKCALLPSFRIDFFKQTASNRSNVKTTTARRQTVWLGWSVVWAGYVAMYIVLVPWPLTLTLFKWSWVTDLMAIIIIRDLLPLSSRCICRMDCNSLA